MSSLGTGDCTERQDAHDPVGIDPISVVASDRTIVSVRVCDLPITFIRKNQLAANHHTEYQL
ncbi:hypothetical protein KFU94_08035 [Chloroflexi bacterium TSY]|nr:hypothetical protein [Chloroflexi bacterium TSY]